MILLVESDPSRSEAIARQLAIDGYEVRVAHTAQHARALTRGVQASAVVLGEVDGPRGRLELLEAMRLRDGTPEGWSSAIPVLVIGLRSDQLGMLRAFDAGADDYLGRPASYLELRARLRALLRRSEPAAAPLRVAVGPLVLDVQARKACLGGRPLILRRLEFELLRHLAGAPDRVFTRHELLRSVWGYRCVAATRTVDSHASRLRRKLQVSETGQWIVNVRGVGYRLR